MFWLLAGYMWLFVHRPFEVWPALGTFHIERIYMIVTIAYWALAADKTWIRNRLNPAFILLWAVVLAAWLFSPYTAIGAKSVENYFKIVVFYVLVMSTLRDERDLKRLAAAFLVAMGLYMAHSFREFLCGRHRYTMETVRMLGVDEAFNDPNTFGATVLYGLPMVYPLWLAATKGWQRWALAGYVTLSVSCILLTGSRTAFAGLCFLSLFIVASSKYRVRLAALCAVAAPLVWIGLRVDLQNRFLTLIDPSYGPQNARESAEGRGKGWRDGVRLWRESPVFGVGPGAFRAAREGEMLGMESHHLYGHVLGELGSAGAIAFALVVLAFIANAFERRRLCRAEPSLKDTFDARVISATTVIVVLLLALGFGGHNLYRYTWLWVGAFQAIAIHWLRRQEVDVPEPETVVEIGPVESTAYGTGLVIR